MVLEGSGGKSKLQNPNVKKDGNRGFEGSSGKS